MTARRATLGVLGLAVLVLAFVGGQAASQDFEPATAEPIPCLVGRPTAYIAVHLSTDEPTGTLVMQTITNPRLATSEVFYITGRRSVGVGGSSPISMQLPPQFGGGGWLFSRCYTDTAEVSFQHPIPFVTTFDVSYSAGETGDGFVLLGYWSTVQPDIEVIETE